MDAIQQHKRKKALRRHRIAASTFTFIFAIAAILCMVGIVATVLVLELRRGDVDETLLYILTGAFAGGAVVFALAGVGLGNLSQRCFRSEQDFHELCVSSESFFVGDGTLATFAEGKLLLHDEGTPLDRAEISVPYSELRFFSVCTRRAPREKGEWSVVIEIPAHYLRKDAKKEKNASPALVQTDAKERLYTCLENRGLKLLGEEPPRGKKIENKKFKPQKKFGIPVVKKRRRALLFLAVGIVALGGGLAVAFTLSATVGSVVAVLGVFAAGRSVFAFVKAKAVLAFCEEGIWWRDENRTDSIFLKWSEVESVYAEERDSLPCICAVCAYGNYHFPNPVGAFEYLQATKSELCRGKDGGRA